MARGPWMRRPWRILPRFSFGEISIFLTFSQSSCKKDYPVGSRPSFVPDFRQSSEKEQRMKYSSALLCLLLLGMEKVRKELPMPRPVELLLVSPLFLATCNK
jgi:hypothetical protein